MKEFREFQDEVAEWGDRNFPKSTPYQPLLGLAEEVGELSHAHLKGEQGLRHTPLEIHRMKKDAVGDILIFLAHYCHKNNFDLQDCKDMVWEQVKQRDWIKNQKNGIVPPVEEFKPFGDTIADEMILDEVSGI